MSMVNLCSILWTLGLAASHLQPANEFKCVRLQENGVLDGDTIKVEIPSVHPILTRMSIRVYGVQAPEVHSKDACELKRGFEAKAFVQNELKDAKRIDIVNLKWGKFAGRILGDVIYDGKNLREALTANNLVIEYYGKKKPEVNWCGDLPVIQSQRTLP